MSEYTEHLEQAFERLGRWSYTYYFGVLHAVCRQYLRGECTRDNFTAVFALVDMRCQRHQIASGVIPPFPPVVPQPSQPAGVGEMSTPGADSPAG